MSKARGDKGQQRGSKGQSRGNKSRGRAARGKAKPGVLESWEDFNETAMAEYMQAVAEDLAEQLDALEEALRSEN